MCERVESELMDRPLIIFMGLHMRLQSEVLILRPISGSSACLPEMSGKATVLKLFKVPFKKTCGGGNKQMEDPGADVLSLDASLVLPEWVPGWERHQRQ